ncbi:DNA cytosine methyltransferase [Streptococcus equinus]|uniref:DNA cytosine methyltransferase n=1 Tax=Streptococcus equinus TaxID=1335 RepID=UPI0008E07FF0|nr:DNA (cytosine-5-)-methyltransferase [Streptococcus equinus]SFQ64123.1 DNA (cytosine-5)-methyltransferase 1 [Streptococcus equinus]
MERIDSISNGLKVVSLFSGIGGLDLGFINAGFDVIWANDNDKNAVKTYKENIDSNIILGDINEHLDEIPAHDVLIAGFPCQPFSMMGKQKGFEDERGTLFFTIEKILSKHQPKIIVLENVKNLLTHNGGETYKRMKEILEEKLGYQIYAKVLNTRDFGLPQVRRRVFIVGFLSSFSTASLPNFEFPKEVSLQQSTFDLLDHDVDKKYFLSEKILPTILSDGSGGYKSKSEINLSVAKPLTATMHKMHRANQDNYFVDNENRKKFQDTAEKPISNIRRLTPNECRKLQGFPSDWKYVVSDTQLYRQFGNAVSVDVAYYVATSINKYLERING